MCTMEEQYDSRKAHIAVFPCVGVGHFIPAAEFARRLCAYHGFSVTIITTKWMCATKQVTYAHRLSSFGFDICFTELPDIAFDEEDDTMKIETRISKFMEKAAPHVGNILQSLLKSSSPISALVTDFFCTAMFDVTAKLNIPTYILFTSTALMLCVALNLPKLLSEHEIPSEDGADCSVEIPGLPLISARDLPEPIQDRSNPAFHWTLHHWSRLPEATGILINTFEDLEAETVQALKEGKVLSTTDMPSIYVIGPLISEPEEAHECLKWLDKQPPSSVLFVSFGSGAFLSRDQITELAHGLEASGHRFLWVLRGERKYITFAPKQDMKLSQLLPDGFTSRTRDRGLVVPNWAPQIPILSYSSTGGFLSHCGWNSTLESVSYGVPMIGWPVFAEQRLNRFMLVNEIKVAIDLKMERDGFVKRAEVERAVKALMEGEEGIRAREKMKEMEGKAKVALMEGGTSYKAHLMQNRQYCSTAFRLSNVLPVNYVLPLRCFLPP